MIRLLQSCGSLSLLLQLVWYAQAKDTKSCIEKLDYDCGMLTSCLPGSSCSWGHCYCAPGTCAGLDDTCHQGQYQRLQGTYKISNVRWPDHFVYMGTFGGSGISKDASGDESEFIISVVHAPTGGGLAVLLTSKKWPDWALTMVKQESKDANGKKIKSYSFHSQKIDNDAEVEDTATLLYSPPVSSNSWASNASMVMLRGVQRDEFAYVPRGSWSISGDEDDKGTGMYWYISPALPSTVLSSMHAYTGSRCRSDCGTVGGFQGFVVSGALRGLSVSCFTIALFVANLGSK
eukprot:TRINITY_DN77491_c0_g1_i1.p1 TRINITY_DN77491_c0_g1~~TRINITY_DN77491_c0_g1_i1.p1  ORF type:complete len:290 (-),score=16.89 TRINITY_DN77491_c0_g1_i1:61-930(-)